jgi:hypothetical protein
VLAGRQRPGVRTPVVRLCCIFLECFCADPKGGGRGRSRGSQEKQFKGWAAT